jgi:hypothetical protein
LIIFNIVILLILTGLYLASIRRPWKWQENPNKKEHKLCFLYPMAELILSITGEHKYLQPKAEINDSIKALKFTSKPELLQRFYLYNKIALVLVVIALFSVLSILGQVSSMEVQQLRGGRYIERPEQGEGSKETNLDVTIHSGDNNSPEGDSTFTRNITLEIGERSYTPEEVEQLFEEGKSYLPEHVLGENNSADEIYWNLSFFDTIPNTGIAVEWKPEDNRLIAVDGTVKNEELQKGVKTTVTAVLIYEEQRTSICLAFMIMPKILTVEEKLDQLLEQELLAAQERSRRDKELTLPEKFDQYNLLWKEVKEDSGSNLWLFGILIAAVMWYANDMELKQQMKFRREQLLMDYPEIINKFTLLVNAGMTVRQAWYKVAEDYQAKRLQGNTRLHYAYEEMLTTVNELKLGSSENNAYEQYGRRIGLIPYIKFSSLISQNRKKGNRGFTELLRQEALEAFEDRKEMAKRLGEEAGTKLLAPMMFLLLIVFLIIMIPAFMAFKI